MRVKLRMDKYVIWTIFCAFSVPECENTVINVFSHFFNNQANKIDWNNLVGFGSAAWSKVHAACES